jgi:hypothetical protein
LPYCLILSLGLPSEQMHHDLQAVHPSQFTAPRPVRARCELVRLSVCLSACKTGRIIQCLLHAETGERIDAKPCLAKHRSRPLTTFHVGHCLTASIGGLLGLVQPDASDASSPTTGYTHVRYPVKSLENRPASTKRPAYVSYSWSCL